MINIINDGVNNLYSTLSYQQIVNSIDNKVYDAVRTKMARKRHRLTLYSLHRGTRDIEIPNILPVLVQTVSCLREAACSRNGKSVGLPSARLLWIRGILRSIKITPLGVRCFEHRAGYSANFKLNVNRRVLEGAYREATIANRRIDEPNAKNVKLLMGGTNFVERCM